MGGSATKFRKHLQRGDEYAALQLCERHPELRRSLDPNASYGEAFGHNTPLHYAAKHSMKALIRIFVKEMGGNPNKKNGEEATATHLVCQGGARLSRNLDGKVRSECLAVLLGWEGPLSPAGVPERADVDAIDTNKNTPLHYAAASGLKKCVEMLVCKGANMSIENEAKDTPCDVSEKNSHFDIAAYLETKMVFSNDARDDLNDEDLFPVSEQFNGLREQDLMEAKDRLLVETSDMLQVPLFTAEALLRNHEWSRQALWQAWNRDPVVCCERCGVQPPLSALECVSSESSPAQSAPPIASEQVVCGICMEPTPAVADSVKNGECLHEFCKNCWKQYATVKILEGDLHRISCPAFECSKLVPLELIEEVVSPSMARKYLTFDIKAFVESNPRIKWCPFPGCTTAVRFPDAEEELPMYMRAFPKLQPPPPTSRSVFCPLAHCFCWDCLCPGHEPTSCAKWKEWQDKISQIKPEELSDTGSASETAANCLWLVTHSKPCPKCKSPIQKNEGCNHMKCSKCKHDFCWVCLGPWKKHSTETGGYFRCNRYDETKKMEEKTEQAIAEAKEQSKRAQELNRFVHYYSRHKNHLNSYEMEKSLLDRLDVKMEALAKSAPSNETEEFSLEFVQKAIDELLRSRKVLSSSYAYGYFLKDCGYNKTIFEYLQNELEVSVESLSGLVGRSYLRGSRLRIQQTTQLVASRRQRFLLCISRGLVPPETPPSLRKSRRRHLPAILGLDKDDEDWVKAGLAPLEDVDPLRPWVKDTRGRHHNLLTILDWPEDVASDEEQSASSPPSSPSVVCCRAGCTRAKARNPRTGDLHQYCSLKCQYLDSCDEESGTEDARRYNVDLMIALQMSRLQLLQDLKVLCGEDDGEAEPSTSRRSDQQEHLFLGEDVDPDLQLAIERSVVEAANWEPQDLAADPQAVHQLLKGMTEKELSGSALNQAENALKWTEDKNADKVLIQSLKSDKSRANSESSQL